MTLPTMYKLMKGKTCHGIGHLDDCFRMLRDISKDRTYYQIEREDWYIQPTSKRTPMWAAMKEIRAGL